ncbi:hypothetical protein BGZ81_000692 [Podila clonocystis]|nr:hypothetical protein BGZ81_000692 [Podila clonocystis]
MTGYFPKDYTDMNKISLAKVRNSLLPHLQLATIPYKTISVHWRPVLQSSTDAPVLLSPLMGITPTNVYSKLVPQSQGGYCLKINCLLGYELQSFGFHVNRVTAKIACDIKVTAK